jgi:Xaa-Pro aminopeptidase
MNSRIDRLVGRFEAAGIDRLLVAEPSNLRYLTGFTGSNGLALVGRDELLFLTDFRYVEQAGSEVDPDFERVRAEGELTRELAERLGGAGSLRVGFDDAHLSVRGFARLRDLLPAAVELVPAAGLVEALRRIKEPEEVQRIAAAARLADQAFEQVVSRGIVGRTERDLALNLETTMRELGASGPSFPSIVAAGAHGARPHAEPRDLPVPAGQLVVVDWGASLDGYCSDCTRTLATGQLDGEAAEVYGLVLGAQRAGMDAVRAGIPCRELDGIVRGLITEGGYGEQFGHGLGHGVGLQTHEDPRLSLRSDDVLQDGEVITIEPGVYLPGRFGVRIEDLVVVGEEGGESLTGQDRSLRVVS